eukprot:c9357_g1_i1.p1 GENE.c9357_g1_i1~~c9357_g1_i1.p1  ORF type:complete len:1120 (-),score=336.69 c9357_g1_i1:335-3694(-)
MGSSRMSRVVDAGAQGAVLASTQQQQQSQQQDSDSDSDDLGNDIIEKDNGNCVDDDDGDDKDDDDEDEPKLKYERLGNSALDILHTDHASCLFVFQRFLVLGTRAGRVFVLDFKGNKIREFFSHTSVVNEVSVDKSGEFIASCGDDNRVVVNGLYTPEPVIHSFSHVVKFVAIDPHYKTKTSKVVVHGGPGQLLATAKTWFTSKHQVISHEKAPIHALQWRGSLVAYATPERIVVLDSRSWTSVAAIPRDEGTTPPNQYRCCLCWEADGVLMIGWADKVTVVRLTSREQAGRTQWSVDASETFTTNFWISGLAPFGTDLVVLAYYDIEEDGTRAKPEVKLLTRDGDELTSDTLKVKGYEEYNAMDYRLDSRAEESLHYVVSPRDIVVARQRDLEDHIAWLLKKAKDATTKGPQASEAVCGWYEKACRATLSGESNLHHFSVQKVGEMYLQHLLATKQFGRAAEWCPRLLRRDAQLWEQWIMRFSFVKQLPALSDFIPLENPRLGQGQYEMVLGSFLSSDNFEGFYSVIEKWPGGVYDSDVITTSVKARLDDNPNSRPLKMALIKLHTDANQHSQALDMYLTLTRKDHVVNAEQTNVFKYIEKHNLFENIKNKVVQLLKFDEKRTIQLLVSNTDRVGIKVVVDQLNDTPFQLHLYLHALFKKDHRIATEYHERQLSLYAEYMQDQLLPFLRSSDSYPLETARRICEEKKLHRELVYVLDRMGSVHEALQLLITELQDVQGAIQFVVDKKDDTLWDILISHSLTSPRMVGELLEHMGVLEDPLQLIRRIPTGILCDGMGTPFNDAPPADGGELVQDVQHCLHNVNQIPSILVFLESLPATSQKAVIGALDAVARKRNQRRSPKIMFFEAHKETERSRLLRRQLHLTPPGPVAALEMVYVSVVDEGRFFLWSDPPAARGGLKEDVLTRFIATCEYQLQNDLTTRGSIVSMPESVAIESRQLGMDIPDLRQKLTKITRDASNEVSLLKGCQQILENDCVSLSGRLHKHATRGMHVTQTCAMCSQPITPQSLQQKSSRDDKVTTANRFHSKAVVFFCGHSYHFTCLPDTASGVNSGDIDASIGMPRVFCVICKSADDTSAARRRGLRLTLTTSNPVLAAMKSGG